MTTVESFQDEKFIKAPSKLPPDNQDNRAPKLAVVLAISLGFIMAILDVTVVNVALGDIQHEFGSALPTLVWIIDAYTLTFASLLMLGGSLADWLGAKQAYALGLLIFVFASALCGGATSTNMLIIARLLQGCSAAFFVPSSLTLLTESFPDRATRTKMVGVWGAFIGAAAGAGPFIGGLLVHQFGWRSIFYLNLPIGALGVLLTAILLRPSQRSRRPFDLVSHLLIVGTLSGLSYTLIEGPSLGWFASRSIVLSTFTLVSTGALFLLRERTARHPVIPIELLHNRPFWALNGVGSLISFVLFGEIFVVSLFLEKDRGASAFWTGVEMLPIMGVFAFMNYFSGHLAARWGGRRIMTIGFSIGAFGAVTAALLGSSVPYWEFVLAVAACNAGFALATPAMVASVLYEAGEVYANVGSAMLNANRQVGALCGVAVMGLVIDLVPAWALSFRIAFATFAVCLLAALILVRMGARHTSD